VIVFLENVISAHTQRWLLVLGVIYVAVTLFAPAGLLGLARRRRRARAAPAPTTEPAPATRRAEGTR
jgi:hypothetical protein